MLIVRYSRNKNFESLIVFTCYQGWFQFLKKFINRPKPASILISAAMIACIQYSSKLFYC